MNSNRLATVIQDRAKELNDLIAASVAGNLSAIEHELIKQKCVELYDLLLQLEPSYRPSELNPVTINQPDEQQPQVSLFNAPPEADVIAEPEIPVKPAEPFPVIPELLAVTEEKTGMEEKTETELQNEIIDEIIELKHEAEITTPSKETSGELSLHEKIASALPPKTDLTERIISNIASLKSAINVNLKIAMVNELFNESSVEYVKAIDRLNSSENIHEAMRYFSELKHTYNWESDHHLVKELETLINKRFAV